MVVHSLCLVLIHVVFVLFTLNEVKISKIVTFDADVMSSVLGLDWPMYHCANGT